MMMRDKLDDISRESFNKFGLRVGISCGPLVCGVIGARKPVFDIWGDTVNLASRMDSTGIIGHIQVPKETAQVVCFNNEMLKTLHISFSVAFSERIRTEATWYH